MFICLSVLIAVFSVYAAVTPNFEERWSYQEGGPSNDELFGAIKSTDGFIYTVGDAANSFLGQPHLGNYDGLVVKFDQDGTVIWARQFGTSVADTLQAIVQTSDGNFVVGGHTQGQVGSDPLRGGWDAWMIKFDADGNVIWNRQFGNNFSEEIYDIVETIDGGLLAVGYRSDNDDPWHGWVAKFDADGNNIWNQSYSTDNDSILRDVLKLDNGHFIVSGNTYGTIAGNTNSGGSDAVILEIDEVGQVMWAKMYGTPGDDFFLDVIPDGQGEYYVLGSTWGSFNGQPNLGSQDGLIMKMDATGNEVWTKLYGTNLRDGFNHFELASDGNLMVAGITYGTSKNGTKIGGYGYPDGWITCISPEGVELWGKQFGSTVDDSIYRVLEVGKGYIGVGYTRGATTGNIHQGASDVWLVNINEAYWLDYQLNGAPGVAPEKELIFVGDLANKPADPIWDGFVFNGWFLDVEGTTPFDFSNTIHADTTIYAKWSEVTYPLSFNPNGGTGVFETQNLVEGALATEPTNPIREGFTFEGWNTQIDGTGMNWDFATSTMPASEVTLFAQWSINQYLLSFDLNGAQGQAPTQQQLYFGDKAVEPITPIREGYQFLGWNTQADGTGMNWDFATSTMPATDTTLFAQWSINQYLLSFDLNGAQGQAPTQQQLYFGDKAVEPITPIRDGYQFLGWNTQTDGTGMNWDFATSTMPATDTTLFAQWQLIPTIRSFELSFNLNGGVGDTPKPQVLNIGNLAVEPEQPVRDGYLFMEWNTRADGKGLDWDFSSTTMPGNNVVLYAQWQSNDSMQAYLLRFDLNGGAGETPNNQLLLSGDLAKEPAKPIREGYEFIGGILL